MSTALTRDGYSRLLGTVHGAQVGAAVLGADAIGERVVVVRLDDRVAAHFEGAVAAGIEHDKGDGRVGREVLGLLTRRVQRDAHLAVFVEKPDCRQLWAT